MANTRYGLRCSPRWDIVCCGNKPCQTKLKERIKNCVLEGLRMQHYGLIRDHLTVPSYQEVINHRLSFHQLPMYQQQLLHHRRFLTRQIIGTSRHHLIQLQQTQLIYYRSSKPCTTLPVPGTPSMSSTVSNNPPSSSSNRTKHWNISTTILPARANQLIHPLAKVVLARNIHLQILFPPLLLPHHRIIITPEKLP